MNCQSKDTRGLRKAPSIYHTAVQKEPVLAHNVASLPTQLEIALRIRRKIALLPEGCPSFPSGNQQGGANLTDGLLDVVLNDQLADEENFDTVVEHLDEPQDDNRK
jgi:hypothetical protein